MEPEGIARAAIAAAMGAGASHVQCRWTEADKQELNAEWDHPSLLRSTFDRRLHLTAIARGGKASVMVNELSPAAVDRAASDVVALANASRPDEANAIAEFQPPAAFTAGPQTADLDGMYARLDEFLTYRQREHPKVSVLGLHFDFTRTTSRVQNTNGVDLTESTGVYTFAAMFSARQGADVSSFNSSSLRTRDIDAPIAERGSFRRLLGESAEQIRTGRIPEKFVGDLVVTPDCLPAFVDAIASCLRDEQLVAGTSVFQERLGEPIAAPAFTLRSCPVSDVLACSSFVTRDGYVASDHVVIEDGVLRSFLLSEYGARKTRAERAPSDGDTWVVDPGTTPLEDLLAGVERGVLLCRFSGGRPSEGGDFSGVAKNSYLIRDGRLVCPLAETMVSGNLVRLVQDVVGVSRERVDFGSALLPWVRFSGVTVS